MAAAWTFLSGIVTAICVPFIGYLSFFQTITVRLAERSDIDATYISAWPNPTPAAIATLAGLAPE
jgi:hypothetical protein